MTVMEFFGCALIAFGPPLALCYFTIRPDPVKIVILMASAFFWLVSLLLSSIWWHIVVPLRDVLAFALAFSVVFQELFRLLIYVILRKAETGLKKVTDSSTTLIDNKHILAYVSGLGFGIMSGAFALANLLAEACGPGTIGIHAGGGTQSFYLVSSVTALCFILLHTVWGVSFFDALDKRKYSQLAFVICSHFIASFLTLLNKEKLHWVSIPANYIILIVNSWVAFRAAGGRINKSELFNRQPVSLHVTD